MKIDEKKPTVMLFYLLSIFFSSKIITWILHESEAFIGKASKDEVVVFYFESLATQHMEASGSPNVLGRSSKSEAQRVKINMIKSIIVLFTH